MSRLLLPFLLSFQLATAAPTADSPGPSRPGDLVMAPSEDDPEETVSAPSAAPPEVPRKAVDSAALEDLERRLERAPAPLAEARREVARLRRAELALREELARTGPSEKPEPGLWYRAEEASTRRRTAEERAQRLEAAFLATSFSGGMSEAFSLLDLVLVPGLVLVVVLLVLVLLGLRRVSRIEVSPAASGEVRGSDD